MIPFATHVMYISAIFGLLLCILVLLGIIRTYKVILTKRQKEALDRIERLETTIAVSQQDVEDKLRNCNVTER